MQEYVFGNMRLHGEDVQYLRVSADHEINLPIGMHGSHKETFSDSVVTTAYRVIREIKSETSGGLHYKWYLVDDVVRTTEKNENSIMARLNALENAVLALLGGEADV